ncbi:bacterio-opsin activator domain-containing protein [Natronolimnohabitans sp. A-GB9]|uniref:bacterio-opsin activator domain-containing protein n=1 Tax=Natronolimnohabitans sp. A-GB9 TaxID=3069757 RepID=UPI0027B6D209|nr:bacterio-opsin activator domain-containing protein [Natronolimnohabitans sp. A-GB9]MDQ2050040.1 bacterio-opsin activator domain-containing protein [Natronolimnohabitans sp. A-GB9]
MENADAEYSGRGDATPAAAALEAVVDPVVAVTDGTITYANRAARDVFDLPNESTDDEPGSGDWDAVATLESWSRLETAIDETAVGTARRVSLECDDGTDHRYDARIHRSVDGATITFEPARDDRGDDGTSVVGTRDRAVKERAINEAPVGIVISDPDREDNPLVYINDAYEEITGYDYDEVVGRNCRFLQGEDTDEAVVAEMAAAIDEQRPVTVEVKNYRKDGSEFWNEVTIAPVRDESGQVTHYVGFQNDVTARKEAELELEARTDELEFLLDRVEGLVGDVTDVVAGSTDRSALEEAVCERIADESAYDGAWIGERNPATGTIEIRATTGEEPSKPVAMADDHPAAAALAAGDATTDTLDGTTRAAFPLSYNGIEYGVLTVRTDGDREIDDRETVVLSALARSVASGINARETSRVLETDAVVAVEVALTDTAVAPVALSSAADCRLEYRRSVHRTGNETASLFTVTGPDATATDLTAAAAEAELDCRVVVEHDEACLIELTGGDALVGWLSERGVRTRAIESEDGRARVTLEIPRSTNVRSIVEALEDRYAGTDVISFRQRERQGETRQEFAARLERELTERQFAALQRAYLSGYFEWPRPTTGEELAQSMGVSRPTFHEHLRTAEEKLCRAFFDDTQSSG